MAAKFDPALSLSIAEINAAIAHSWLPDGDDHAKMRRDAFAKATDDQIADEVIDRLNLDGLHPKGPADADNDFPGYPGFDRWWLVAAFRRMRIKQKRADAGLPDGWDVDYIGQRPHPFDDKGDWGLNDQ